jgi:hypothetical protein
MDSGPPKTGDDGIQGSLVALLDILLNILHLVIIVIMLVLLVGGGSGGTARLDTKPTLPSGILRNAKLIGDGSPVSLVEYS